MDWSWLVLGYSTSLMCSVVLATCTRLPACCVSVALVVLGTRPSRVELDGLHPLQGIHHVSEMSSFRCLMEMS